MIIAGLTGSIAMGKSTVAAMFAALGCPVFDADAAVAEFYQSARSQVVEAAFPNVRIGGAVSRERLAVRVLGDPAAMKRLEAIVHPIVGLSRLGFLEEARSLGRRVVFLDVPLLFETGGERDVDVVVVVTASARAQRERALAREGMTVLKLKTLLARQTPDSEKRRRAHFVVDTDVAIEQTRAQAESFVRAIVALPGRGIRSA